MVRSNTYKDFIGLKLPIHMSKDEAVGLYIVAGYTVLI